jgi:hypothetical protein
MLDDPIGWLPPIPEPILLPLTLLLLGLFGRWVLHEETAEEFLPQIPPRLALTAAGIFCAAALSPVSYLTVNTRDRPGLLLSLSILVVITYISCESILAKIRKGKLHAAWTLLGGALAYGLTSLATRLLEPKV